MVNPKQVGSLEVNFLQIGGHSVHSVLAELVDDDNVIINVDGSRKVFEGLHAYAKWLQDNRSNNGAGGQDEALQTHQKSETAHAALRAVIMEHVDATIGHDVFTTLVDDHLAASDAHQELLDLAVAKKQAIDAHMLDAIGHQDIMDLANSVIASAGSSGYEPVSQRVYNAADPTIKIELAVPLYVPKWNMVLFFGGRNATSISTLRHVGSYSTLEKTVRAFDLTNNVWVETPLVTDAMIADTAINLSDGAYTATQVQTAFLVALMACNALECNMVEQDDAEVDVLVWGNNHGSEPSCLQLRLTLDQNRMISVSKFKVTKQPGVKCNSTSGAYCNRININKTGDTTAQVMLRTATSAISNTHFLFLATFDAEGWLQDAATPTTYNPSNTSSDYYRDVIRNWPIHVTPHGVAQSVEKSINSNEYYEVNVKNFDGKSELGIVTTHNNNVCPISNVWHYFTSYADVVHGAYYLLRDVPGGGVRLQRHIDIYKLMEVAIDSTEVLSRYHAALVYMPDKDKFFFCNYILGKVFVIKRI